MPHKTFLCCLLLMLPTLFMGQVLQEINEEPTDLPDPDQYPFGVYLKLGLPGGSFTHETGHQNLRQILQDGGFRIPKTSQVNVFELGARYKRLYLDMGVASQFINSPIPPFLNSRSSVNSSSMMVWVNAGYSVFQNRNSALILRLGIGGGESSYQIRSLENVSQVDFDNLLTGGGSTTSSLIYHEDTFLDMSLELWRGRAKSRTSLGSAIRLGYRQGLNETAWETLDAPSINAPLDRMSEIYLNICIHLGYNFPKKAK